MPNDDNDWINREPEGVWSDRESEPEGGVPMAGR